MIHSKIFKNSSRWLPFNGFCFYYRHLHTFNQDSSPRTSNVSSDSSNNIFNGSNSQKPFKFVNVLSDLKQFLDTAEVNCESQEFIENLLTNHYNNELSLKAKNIQFNINMDIINPKLSSVLQKSHDDMLDYIKQLPSIDIRNPKNLTFEEANPDMKSLMAMKIMFSSLDALAIRHYMLCFLLKVISAYYLSEGDYTNVTKSLIELGRSVTDGYFIQLHRKFNQNNSILTFSKWRNDHLDKYSRHMYQNDNFYTEIGRLLLDILRNLELLTLGTRRVSHLVANHYFILPDRVLHTLDKKVNIYSLPSKLPMIVKPKIHDDKNLGGYLTNDVLMGESLIIPKSIYKEESHIADSNCIYSMVNDMGNTEFKINNEMLNFLLTRGYEYKLLATEDERTICEEKLKTRNTPHYKDKLKSISSKLHNQEIIISIANAFSKHVIYFPVRLDQRGRLYCSAHYFHYQGSELSKSLLMFNKPAWISKSNHKDVLDWIKVYGSGCYNIGKQSHFSRVKWADDNLNNILNYENGILLKKAKSPFLFLAFCMEMVKINNFLNSTDNTKYPCCLPVQLDASCNGFQHLAMLSTQDDIMPTLNLSASTKNDAPKDFYVFILDKIINKCKKIMKKSTTDKIEKESFGRISKFVWDRSHIKKAIMTIPYNASPLVIQSYLKDAIHPVDFDFTNHILGDKDKPVQWFSSSQDYDPKQDKKSVLINYKDLGNMYSLISDIIKEDFNKIHNLRVYLKNVSSICNSLNVPITWSLPHGLDVNQAYLEVKTERIQIFPYSNKRLNLNTVNRNKYDYRKQKTALMPNLIHSLDAASMSLLYKNLKILHPDISFYTIHDCFATTPDKLNSIINGLRVVYTELYSDSAYLQTFENCILNNIIGTYNHKVTIDSLSDPNNHIISCDILSKPILLMKVKCVWGGPFDGSIVSSHVKGSLYLAGV